MDKVNKTKKPTVKHGGKSVPRKTYDKAFREKLARMHVEDKIPLNLLSKESGVSVKSICEWSKRFESAGSAGLDDKPRPGRGVKLPKAVDDKIIEIKKNNPEFGVRRIGDILGRWFGLPGSREKARSVLNSEGLIDPPRKVRAKNMVKPRFFERSTPNQLWQTDIMCFRLGGRQVYLIGYIDDYSRYIVGLGLFTSQTAENVLEAYRKASAEYGVPKEMLTDNGRQYTNWRGKTRFEMELQKDKVKHLRSQPHHPQTLGKIERFWKTILDEYLSRAQFESFDNARERIAMWVKHYNHRRPHQGIEGLCPADRYFEVASAVRKVVERTIEENVLELALRGKPREPFYLVGRMDGQSVVLQAEKGKLRLSVGGEGTSEMVQKDFTLGETNGNGREDEEGAIAPHSPYGTAEGAGGAGSVDGAEKTGGDLSRSGHPMDYIGSVAEAGDGRDAPGTGAIRGAGECVWPESSPAGAAVAKERGGHRSETIEACPEQNGEGNPGGGRGINGVSDDDQAGRREGPQADGCYTAGGSGPDDGDRRRADARDLASSFLRVAGTCTGSDDDVAGGPSGRPPCGSEGRGEGAPGKGAGADQGGTGGGDHGARHQADAGGAAPRTGIFSFLWSGR